MISIMDVDEEEEICKSPSVGAFEDSNTSITTNAKSGRSCLELEVQNLTMVSQNLLDTTNCLRLPVKQSYNGDRFIPMRSAGHEQENYSM